MEESRRTGWVSVRRDGWKDAAVAAVPCRVPEAHLSVGSCLRVVGGWAWSPVGSVRTLHPWRLSGPCLDPVGRECLGFLSRGVPCEFSH